MVTSTPIAPGAAAIAEAKNFLRIEHDSEDALIERLIASAAALCEEFTGQVLLARDFSETLTLAQGWLSLSRTPARAITGIEGLAGDGAAFAIPAGDYEIDIDIAGDGWVRIAKAGDARRARIAYEAGIAAAWEDVPEALRQGIVRLTAHFHTYRGAPAGPTGAAREGEAPPAAVTALWRPWRRLNIGPAARGMPA
ncbi:MAG: head-tail connector protein [Sphingomonadaceae bacterium]